MRGEKFDCRCGDAVPRGSPPRARGEVVATMLVSWMSRITPACAGRSTPHARINACRSDHPRVRGEKKRSAPAAPGIKGSPPRARGEVMSEATNLWYPGITPACAGRRAVFPGLIPILTDHPRVRGEKTQTRRIPSTVTGSPPRARGEGGWGEMREQLPGITPACAGRRLKRSPI